MNYPQFLVIDASSYEMDAHPIPWPGHSAMAPLKVH